MSLTRQSLIFELTARLNSLFVPRLSRKLVYIHIPKCGGVSISKALKACYVTLNLRDDTLYKLDSVACLQATQLMTAQPLQVDHSAVGQFREQLLMYGMAQRSVKYISGHFLFSSLAHQQFQSDYGFLTVLRNPVKRWISAYFYDRYKSYGNAKTDLDIEAYLTDQAAIRNGKIYAHSLCGRTDFQGVSDQALIEQAKENLHKFDLVGFTEHLDQFIHQFRGRYRYPLSISRWNQSPKSKVEQQAVLSPSVIERITELCQADMEIYNYAIDQFSGLRGTYSHASNHQLPPAQVSSAQTLIARSARTSQ